MVYYSKDDEIAKMELHSGLDTFMSHEYEMPDTDCHVQFHSFPVNSWNWKWVWSPFNVIEMSSNFNPVIQSI